MRRVDSRGRVIGYNWWRELNVSAWRTAWHSWDERRENEFSQMEDDEYREHFPCPRYKDFLIGNAGLHTVIQ